MDETAEKYLFHDYEVDPVQRVIRHQGSNVAISGKAFDILVELIKKRGEIVTKERLLDTVWHDRFVEENNLTVQISAIRKIFGEKKGENSIIVTIPGTGYSFVAPVKLSGVSLALISANNAAATAESSAVDPLIGREREVGEIGEMLTENNSRLITLTGIGGCGKTRIAAEIIGRFGKSFDGGAYFIELAEVRDPDHLAASVAEKLKIRQSSDVSPVESLKSFFGKRKTLLVLDNFEQIITAAGVLKELLSFSLELLIVVTSRVTLRLREEAEYKVGPLEIPPEAGSSQTGAELGPSSVRLFMIRAMMARRTFKLTVENAPVVAEICRKLDGLPLAIELAAARIKLLSPEAILGRLQKSLDFLTGGGPELPDRQRTIRSTLEWSYDLLDEDERRVFCSLSVFAGGFTMEAAEAIAEPASRPSRSILDIVSALADTGLLMTREQANGSIRLGMLEVVREFALDHLSVSGDLEDAGKRHAEYFLDLAEQAEPHLTSQAVVEWSDTLETEIDNVRSAIQYALDANGQTAARIVAAVRYYWINRSQLTEGCYWLERAIEVGEGAATDVRFKLLAGLGSFYRLRGDLARSSRQYELALDEAAANGRADLVALATAGLGTVARLEGRNDEAHKYFAKALKISRSVSDKRGVSIALNCLADVFLHDGKRAKARECLIEALAIYRELGEKEAECNNLNILGRIELEDNESELAYNYYSQAMAIARSLDNKINTLEALIGFSAIACNAGNVELAATFSGAADKLRGAIDYKLEPVEEEFHNVYLERTRAVLDERSFNTALDTGRNAALSNLLQLTGQRLEDLLTPLRPSAHEIIIETRSTSTITIEEQN